MSSSSRTTEINVRKILSELLDLVIRIIIAPGSFLVRLLEIDTVSTPKWVRKHLRRMLPTMGLTVVITVLLGLIMTAVQVSGWTNSALIHGGLAVVATIPLLLSLIFLRTNLARFLKELYTLKSPTEAHNFLTRLLFHPWGFDPWMRIRGGEISLGEGNVVHRVGGPGYLVVYNDTAVVTERCGRLWRILSGTLGPLKSFEKIWEIIDLRPQKWVFTVNGMTRDGIPVSCEADIIFKIDDRVPDERGQLHRIQPTPQTPYPYTKDAIVRAFRSRWIRHPDDKGAVMNWVGRVVVSFVEGTLRNILAEYRLDWLIAPTGPEDQHPREVICKKLRDQLEGKAQNVGARIIDVRLGEIHVDEKIPEQWIKTWQAEWESRSLATRAEAEAELLRMDIARSQVQMDMITKLIEAVQSVATSEEEARSYVMATRFVEMLHWMTYDPMTRSCMPSEAMQTLKQIQRMLERKELPQSQMSQR